MAQRIRSISYSQAQILGWIQELYCKNGFDLDPTFGNGSFYLEISRPRFCFDIDPREKNVGKADARQLPFKDRVFQAIIIDPPFLLQGGEAGIMTGRYGTVERRGNTGAGDIWQLYMEIMQECTRLLKLFGVLVVKCQDIIIGRTQYMSHLEIANIAIDMGLYPVDIFILLARTRPMSWNHGKQAHARKYHAYFLIFKKSRRNVGYSRGRRISVYEK